MDRTYPLLPEEEPFISGAVAARRVEFSTGRWCAREALQALGGAPVPILQGPRREPVWPAGFLGSITHTSGICAVVAVRASDYAGVGIDLVDLGAARALLEGPSNLIAADQELSHARGVAGTHAEALVFSAKESVIKAVSARLGRFVDFREIQVSFQGTKLSGTCADFPGFINGWWRITGQLAITAASARLI